MVTKKDERTPIKEIAPEQGSGLLILDKLLTAPDAPVNTRMFEQATLAPDAEVGYHKHVGESEAYYILSGTAPNMEKAQKLSELYGIPLAYIDFTREGNRTALKDRKKETGVTL